MNNPKTAKTKYLLLVMMLIAVFALPGCRTRITNNNEVSNIKYDEDGFLTETYQMRRDELGLSTAEKPLMPDLGSDDDDSDDAEPSENFNYTPEEPEPEPAETNTNTNNNNNSNNGSGTNRGSREELPDDEDDITITFDANGGTFGIGGSGTKKVTGKFGQRLPSFPEDVLREGYHSHLGWYTEKTGGEKIDTNYEFTEDITLYAHWDITVTFNASGGTFSDGAKTKSFTYKKNASIKKPEAPGRKSKDTEYEFTGWFTDPVESDDEFKEGTKAASDVTYYAHWNAKKEEPEPTPAVEKFKVSFIDGQGNTLKEEDVEKGKAATAPADPVREGYKFAGWDKDFSKVESTLIVTAKWIEDTPEPTTYTINFNVEGGTAIDSRTVEAGDITAPNNKRDGYKFLGWSIGEDGDTIYEAGDTIPISADTELYAHWEGDKTSVKYWNDEIEKAADGSNNTKCYIDGTNEEKSLVEDCKPKEVVASSDEADLVIVFADPADDDELNTILDTYSGKELIVISKSVSNDKAKAVYKAAILKQIQNSTSLDYKEIATELSADYKIYYPTD